MRVSVAWRISRFSAVGLLGTGVQLAVLVLLLGAGANYLAATAAAVECAVLHNFAWHRRFTWRDRMAKHWREKLLRLFRFQLSNGAISMVGNVILMRLLVGYLRIPALAANVLAIAACFAANFLVSDKWVFARGQADATRRMHQEISIGV